MKTWFGFLMLIFLASATAEAKQKYGPWDCPVDLKVDPNQKLKEEVIGWEVAIIPERYRFFLKSVHIYYDHPSKLGTLKLKKGKNGDLLWKRGANEKKDSWVVCEYNDTSLLMYRKIPRSIGKCIIAKGANPFEISVSCTKN